MQWVHNAIESVAGKEVDWRVAAGGLAGLVVAGMVLHRILTPSKDIKGAIVVITGASSGIGRAAAKQLAVNKGATVIALARRREKLEELADEVYGSNGKIIPVSCDCSSGEEIISAVATARSEQAQGKPFAGVINNAGTGLWHFLHELEDTSEVYSAMKAPVCASLVTTKSFLPLLAESALARSNAVREAGLASWFINPPGAPPAPRILSVTSPASVVPMPGATCYSIARRAVRGFTDGMRADLRGTGIEAQEVLLGEVSSSYWANNPGSRESLPGISKVLPTMTEEQAGAEVVSAFTTASDANVVAPASVWLLMWIHWLMPGIFEAVLFATAPTARLDDIIASGGGAATGQSQSSGGRPRASSRSRDEGKKQN